MGTSFVTFVFVGLTWLPNGSLQPPVVMTETSIERCEQDIVAFQLDGMLKNSNEPAFLKSVYQGSCVRIISLSDKKAS
jgi:hypothetical protein